MQPSAAIRSAASFAAFAGLTAGVAALGSRHTLKTSRGLWYRVLRKAAFQPPSRAFGPVWTGLYALIATSGHRVFQARSPGRSRALALWGAQLGFNAAWSYLFFARRRPKAALVDIGLLFGAIAAYAAAARKVDRPAAWMMAPYLGWVAFASVLNASIVRKNPSALLEP